MPSCRHVLLAPSWDQHADRLNAGLWAAGCQVQWLRTDRPLPDLAEIASLPDVRSAVFRRAQADPHGDPGIDAYIQAEVRDYSFSLGELTNWEWFPASPLRTYRAGLKPLQLQMAREAGLDAPRTAVGSAHESIQRLGKEIVSKPLRTQRVAVNGLSRWLGTSVLLPGDWSRSNELAPSIFQERIAVASEVRIVIIDEFVMGARADLNANTLDHADIKDLTGVKYSVLMEVPDIVSSGLRTMMAALGVRLCSADFLVDAADRWLFIDLNPNGQWLFVQEDTGVNLLTPVIDALHTRRKSSTAAMPLSGDFARSLSRG